MPLRGAAADLEGILRRRAGTLGQRDQAEPQGSGDGSYHAFNVTEEFDDIGLDNLSTDRFVNVLEYVVDPQVAYSWGYGDVNKPDFVGRIYADIRDDADEPITGKLRLWSDNARQNDPEGHGSWEVAELRQTLDRRDSWVKLQEVDMAAVGQDSRLQIQFKTYSDTPPDIDPTNSTVYVSATEFEQP